MNTEISGVVLQLALLIALSYPLGRYIAKVYKGEKTDLGSEDICHGYR